MAVRPFKEQYKRDINNFVDPRYFGATHTLNGKEALITIDSDRLARRMQGDLVGLSTCDLLFFCRAGDLDFEPEPGGKLTYDNRYALIVSVGRDGGMYEIILQFNRGN